MKKELTIKATSMLSLEFAVIAICFLFSEGIFSWLLVPNSGITGNLNKGMSILITGYIIFQFNYLPLVEKIFIAGTAALLIKLVFESLIEYQSIFQQFTVFTVIYPVFFAIFIKTLLTRWDVDLLDFIATFYLIVYLLFMIIYGRAFSFGLQTIELEDYGPFSGDSRIIHARSILMLIIPMLWFLHKFLKTGGLLNIILTGLCFVIIVAHQHRSVWSSALVSLVVFVGLTARNRTTKPFAWVKLFWLLVPVLGLGIFYVSTLFPNAVDFFADRFSEILDPAKEGSTGNFRIEQSEIYLKFIAERPIFGWAFAGFYLDNPLVDWWDSGTGQHFHQGYIEVLFYHGIIGLLLKYGLILWILFKAFRSRLSPQGIVMVSFCLSGLIFSFSYVLPLVYWAQLGMCWYYIEKKPVTT